MSDTAATVARIIKEGLSSLRIVISFRPSRRQNIRQRRLQCGITERITRASAALGITRWLASITFGHLAEHELQREGGHGNHRRPRQRMAQRLGEIGIGHRDWAMFRLPARAPDSPSAYWMIPTRSSMWTHDIH